MGIGTIVIGLAAVIVGESILPSRRIIWATLAVVLGAIVYRFFIAAALNSDFIGLKAQDLNLVTAVLVTLALVLPQLKRKLNARARNAHRQRKFPMLSAQDLRLTFNPGTPIETRALRGLSLDIPDGAVRHRDRLQRRGQIDVSERRLWRPKRRQRHASRSMAWT